MSAGNLPMPRRLLLVLILVCAAVTLLVYGRALALPLYMDDVIFARYIDSLTLPEIFYRVDIVPYYRPLSLLPWKLLHIITGGYDRFWMHAFNLIVHAANGVLVAMLAARLHPHRPPTTQYPPPRTQHPAPAFRTMNSEPSTHHPSPIFRTVNRELSTVNSSQNPEPAFRTVNREPSTVNSSVNSEPITHHPSPAFRTVNREPSTVNSSVNSEPITHHPSPAFRTVNRELSTVNSSENSEPITHHPSLLIPLAAALIYLLFPFSYQAVPWAAALGHLMAAFGTLVAVNALCAAFRLPHPSSRTVNRELSTVNSSENPEPRTQNSEPAFRTVNREPGTVNSSENPEPRTQHPEPAFRTVNREPGTVNSSVNSEPITHHPSPIFRTVNHEPGTVNSSQNPALLIPLGVAIAAFSHENGAASALLLCLPFLLVPAMRQAQRRRVIRTLAPAFAIVAAFALVWIALPKDRDAIAPTGSDIAANYAYFAQGLGFPLAQFGGGLNDSLVAANTPLPADPQTLLGTVTGLQLASLVIPAALSLLAVAIAYACAHLPTPPSPTANHRVPSTLNSELRTQNPEPIFRTVNRELSTVNSSENPEPIFRTVNREPGTVNSSENPEPIFRTVNREPGTVNSSENPEPIFRTVNREPGTVNSSENPEPAFRTVNREPGTVNSSENPEPRTQNHLLLFSFGLLWYAVAISVPAILLPARYAIDGPRLMLLASVGSALVWASAIGGLLTMRRLPAMHTESAQGKSSASSLISVPLRFNAFRFALGLALAAFILLTSARFIAQRMALHDVIAPAYNRLLAEAADDGPTAFVNVPAWLAYDWHTYALGSEGVTYMTDYIGFPDLVYINTGLWQETGAAVAEDIRDNVPGHYWGVLDYRNDSPTFDTVRAATDAQGGAYALHWAGGGWRWACADRLNIRVDVPSRCFEQPWPSDASGVDHQVFSNRIDLMPVAARPEGQTIAVDLAWFVGEPSQVTTFVHLVCGESDVPVAQADGSLLRGLLPFAAMSAGETWRERRYLEIPAGTSLSTSALTESGVRNDASYPDCAVRVGLYDPITGARVPLVDGGDSVTLPLLAQQHGS